VEHAEGFVVVIAKGLCYVDDEDEQVAFFKRSADGVHHAFVDGGVGPVNARGIEEDGLGKVRRHDPLNRGAGGLRLVRNDCDLLAHERVE